MQPAADDIRTRLSAAGVTAEVTVEALGVVARLAATAVTQALSALKEQAPSFGSLVDLFATDTGEALEITYHVRALTEGRDTYLKATVAYDAEVPSVWRVHPAALYPEREAAELFGLRFHGHPNPKRLLTSDEVEGYLLRKSTPIREGEEVRRFGG